MRIAAAPGIAAGAAIPGIIVVDAERVAAEHRDIRGFAWVKLTVELRRHAVFRGEPMQRRRPIWMVHDGIETFVLRNDHEDVLISWHCRVALSDLHRG